MRVEGSAVSAENVVMRALPAEEVDTLVKVIGDKWFRAQGAARPWVGLGRPGGLKRRRGRRLRRVG